MALKMSNSFQSDIFRILNEDHQIYLQPYNFQRNDHQIGRISTECNDLANRITLICNKYTNNIDQDCGKKAVITIKNFLIACRNRRMFKEAKNHLLELKHKHPIVVLKQVNYIHAQIFDMNHFKLVFRLDGNEFPPVIVYNIHPKIDLSIVSLRTSIFFISENHHIYNKWYRYKSIKCHMCSTTLKPRKLNSYRTENRKRKTSNRIDWIQKMYM